ncbi:hypothetical protein H5T88_07360 [bacterium]|nr:hypothetical protein [bacterium]
MKKSEEVNKGYLSIIHKMEKYNLKNMWRGYDPYDGLNSRLFELTPFKYNRSFRLLWSFAIRAIPFNVRPFLLVHKGINPKAISLFISSYSELYSHFRDRDLLIKAKFLVNVLNKEKIKRYKGPSWGYNFPWQSKVLYAPLGMPNAVCTTFAAQALLDFQEAIGSNEFTEMAVRICDFLLNDLNKTITPRGICFSYTPIDNLCVHNVNLWIAALLARVYLLTKNESLLSYADEAVKFTLYHQNPDGSWFYGVGNDNLLYIDNYHSGFNLVALKQYIDYSGNSEYEEQLIRGYNYYKKTFFLPSGAPRYYHNKLFPADIHCCAQGIITHTVFGDLEEAEKIANWTLENMYDEKEGFFYYRKYPAYTIKTPFIRWGQAWMFYALTKLLLSKALPHRLG